MIEWNYSSLAESYVDRPGYAEEAIAEMLRRAQVQCGDRVCDMGAGVGHMTIPLLQAGLRVDAVEPNREMRRLGRSRTTNWDGVNWFEATAEESGLDDLAYRLICFGSSFNVCDRARALQEAARILGPDGWFACAWNHRRLDQPIQVEIEGLIKSRLPDFAYGKRREDQTKVIEASGLFEPAAHFTRPVTHELDSEKWVNAWRSHATLERQAGDKFDGLIEEISDLVTSKPTIRVDYVTSFWMARKR